MKAYLFPGQGSQFSGMGKPLFDESGECRRLFELADEVVGFRLSDIMFSGSAEDLRRTDVTQPAVFVHSVAEAVALGDDFKPDMVAGHSLGEFSALVAVGALSFADGLRLVMTRAKAMQRCCETVPSTMAAVLKVGAECIERVCREVHDESGEIVVPANYNCPGQIVISGTRRGIELASQRIKAEGGRTLPLAVGGAFHSPLMEEARAELQKAIDEAPISAPVCPVYQNVVATPVTDPEQLRLNLVAQLTSPVRWMESIQHMSADGATEFVELGPGKVLTGLLKRIL